tara:strand:+ start:542 stop:1198 length:657 start_codon:yes stop_codon:yes gene_type:complete
LNAQSLLPIKFGIKAGTNISNINSTPITEGTENINTTELVGITGGFYMKIPLNDKWYINPEIVYSQKGANFTYTYTHDYGINEREIRTSSNELKLAYIELNPNVSYKNSDKIAFNFGPSISYLLTPDYNIISDIGDELTTDILPEGNFEEEILDIGINIGFSYYLTEKLIFEARSNTGLMSIGEVSKIIYTGLDTDKLNQRIYDIKNSGLIFSVAIIF